ncbi:MAG TPA: hypothetical protein ENI15_14020 [Spirochaetes bacterium]|nr:hypothetical protein [Spirochaetota bacterium]
MKKRLVIFFTVLIISVCSCTPLFAQQIKEIEFRNQEITDILVALAQMAGISIIPDETVKGRVSYFFFETDFETALLTFLQTYKMYYKKEGKIYYVSKIQVRYETSLDMISMDAEDVDVSVLVRYISEAIGKTILYDSLPSVPLSVHVKNVKPEKLIEILIKRFDNYDLMVDRDYYYIKRIPEKPEITDKGKAPVRGVSITGRADLFSIEVSKARFFEIIYEMFDKAGHEYSILMQRDLLIEKIRFSDKSFEQLLRLVLEQANADYKKVGDIYYIFAITQKDVLKKLKSTIRIPLTYINVQELPKLLPPDLALSKFYKLDVDSNALILSGSLEEIGPIQEFISEIDRPKEGLDYYRFDLSYITVKDIKKLLPRSFKYSVPIVVPNSNSFIILLSSGKKTELEQYLKLIDKAPDVEYVNLKYIKSEYLTKNLPPSITKEDIIVTSNPSIIFVRGSPEKLDAFYKELSIIDRPVPQLRYELLVIQYQEGEALGLNQNLGDNIFTARNPPAAGAENGFAASIGKLVALNFDVVSAFGVQFALRLNMDLSEDKARVLADSTLNGISEEQITFQNTSTYRYREYETDPNTGDLRSTGVVREISSGLKINITGWVSGDGMITMEVEAEVSKRGADVSSDTGKPPTTFEKMIKTNVRTSVGKPIIIGGLIEENKETITQKTPFLGDIPLLGILFRSEKESINKTEFVIYIIPHVDLWEEEKAGVRSTLERLYSKFFDS